jgi:hypothetical protein
MQAPDMQRDEPTSNPPKQHKNDNDNQDGTDDTDTTVSIAVTVATEAATEAAKQENDEDDKQNKSHRHNPISLCIAPITASWRDEMLCKIAHIKGLRIAPPWVAKYKNLILDLRLVVQNHIQQ